MEIQPAEKNNSEIGKKSEPTQSAPDATSELASIVNESRAALNSGPIPIKRGRGRPRKNPEPGMGTGTTMAEPPQAPIPPPEISKIVAPIIRSASNYFPVRYDVAELAFTDDEVSACADSIQNLLNAFFPDLSKMSPQTAAVLGAAITFGSITASKMSIYAAVMKQRVSEAAATQNPPPAAAQQAPQLVPGGRPASQLFQ